MNKYLLCVYLYLLIFCGAADAAQGEKIIGYDKLINPFEKAQEQAVIQPQGNYISNQNAHIISMKLNYIDLEEAKEWITKIFPEIEAGFLKEKNIIVLKGLQNDLIKARKVILNLDKSFKKLNIEVKVIEISSRDLREIGFEWPELSKGMPLIINKKGLVSEDKIFNY